jgi:hypothetical protein
MIEGREKAVRKARVYRRCPYCQMKVTVERRVRRSAVLPLVVTAASLLVTVLLYPQRVFLFVFLPVGFGLWRRAEYSAGCGRRIPSARS